MILPSYKSGVPFAEVLFVPAELKRRKEAVGPAKWLSRALVAILLAFHGWLLATQWAAGRLTEPGLLARWAAALVIAVALTALYRSGATLLSRKSLVIWLLAALLHGPAVASHTGGGLNLNALPEVAVTLLVRTMAVAGAFSITFWLFAALIRRRALATPRPWAFVSILGGLTPLSDGFSAVVSARPPPAQP